ncbi:hypothetical protein KJ891_05600, partial [Candidatus Micrarchaeota archaeon]|nr:hypothetical protein [Candidatus Micrarchaeota archaeon]
MQPDSVEGEERLHNLKFLSKTAMEFVEFPQNEDIYRHTAKRIKQLAGSAVVAVAHFDEAKGAVQPRVILGLGKHGGAVNRLMGSELLR